MPFPYILLIKQMSHLTNKKKKQKEKNNKARGFNGFNTGTRDMGFESNQKRKEQAFINSIREEINSEN